MLALLPQPVGVERRRAAITALHDHSLAAAGAIVAGRAVDVEAAKVAVAAVLAAAQPCAGGVAARVVEAFGSEGEARGLEGPALPSQVRDVALPVARLAAALALDSEDAVDRVGACLVN